MPSDIPPSGSIKALMDEVELLEQQVVDACADDFPVYRYRWRPRKLPDFPCIYNWLGNSPYDSGQTVAHGRDQLLLLTNCGIKFSDVETEMIEVELLADEFRHVVDTALKHGQALGGIPQKADRISMAATVDTFNEVDVLAIQFQIRVDLDRLIP